ncbi:Centromere DNA-binding protein complex CBF3 subunit [Phytophthora infestans]|uniref:Centromere DNA-binding protein complex CBF3 subunit n=1 Tax=Phytophthora infestans TaxID=4787 RepID=A0A833T8U4_PHYIN|nr:Centromere DNA-binding protein complex CBF3 subunit [Phytophthora infestans]
MNPFGRIKYGGCIRHRDVILSPIGALAIYLFWRFHVVGETFPDMRVRSSSGLKTALKACGVTSKKVTHIRRTSSCVIAEANGAFEASIRRGRRWNNEKMEGCYLTTLPRVVVRGLAGFNANGEFFLPRAESSIPETLRGAGKGFCVCSHIYGKLYFRTLCSSRKLIQRTQSESTLYSQDQTTKYLLTSYYRASKRHRTPD